MSKYTDALARHRGERTGRVRCDRTHPDIGNCPDCGSPLVQRDGKFGEFVGCTGYPDCKWTCEVGGEPGPGDKMQAGDWGALGKGTDGHYC